MKSKLLSALFVATVAFLGWPAAQAQSTNYVITPQNLMGLDSSYTVYLMGYSTASGVVLTRESNSSTGVFQAQASGPMPYYELGTGANQISQISMPNNVGLNGARIYFVITQNGAQPPTLDVGDQPPTPPSSYPPYTFVEITVPGDGTDATVDVQAVDGFTMPVTITLNGSFNQAGQQYGQPVYLSGTPTVNRASIIGAYHDFITNQGSAGSAYRDLLYPGTLPAEGYYGGILSPRTYLAVLTPQGQPENVGTFDHLFDDALNTLFSSSTMKVRGVASGAGETPVIAPDTYTTAPVTQNYPGTTIPLPALKFTGTTVPSNVFYIFNPAGVTVLADDNGDAITGTLVGNILTLASKATAVETGMYVGGVGMVGRNGQFQATVTNADNSGATTVLTLANAPAAPAAGSQFLFSKLPYTATAESAGWMVLAQNGFFNDGAVQYPNSSTQAGLATVLNGLENYMSTALNRGVATLSSALNPNDPTNLGLTSQVWADQSNWYPAGQTQNLYAKFLHTGTVSGTSVFFQPAGAINGMGSAYAFPYDENSGPTPPATDTTEVPSKFDQNVAPGTNITVTLGQWEGPTPTPTPTPTPVPPPAPTVKVQGKKTITSSKSKVVIKGQAVGSQLFVNYKKKNGKKVTKAIAIAGDGSWKFKYKQDGKKTVLKFYSQNADGSRSNSQKVTVKDSSED